MRNAVVFCLTIFTLWLVPTGTAAHEGGLRITPVRQFLSVDAGTAVHDRFNVANTTDQPLAVTLSVQQFSVADYSYDYTFNQPDNDWLRLGLTEATLEPGQSMDIPFTLSVPADGTPGGYYYTLLASAKLSSQGLSGTVQAADLLYVTVNGELSRTSHLEGSSIPQLVFGREIAFTIEPRNTGNIHQFAFITGELHGLGAPAPVTSGAHLLMPGKVRTLNASMPAPIWPGMYRATIGYRTDAGQTVTASRMIVVVPPWFIAVLLGALLIAGRFLPGRKRKANTKATADSGNSTGKDQ